MAVFESQRDGEAAAARGVADRDAVDERGLHERRHVVETVVDQAAAVEILQAWLDARSQTT